MLVRGMEDTPITLEFGRGGGKYKITLYVPYIIYMDLYIYGPIYVYGPTIHTAHVCLIYVNVIYVNTPIIYVNTPICVCTTRANDHDVVYT